MNTTTLYSSRFRPFFIMITLIVIAPFFFQSSYALTLLILTGIFSIIALGMSLLLGYAGQISIGHAAFFGLGAYISGILTTKFGVSPWAAMISGMLFTAFVSFIIGIPTLKLKEHFLALATIGINIIFYIITLGFYEYTGGASGLTGIPSLSFFGMSLKGELSYYFLVWGVVLLIALFSLNIVQSHVGRILRAIHDSEIATLTQGVDAAKYKLHIFVISAVFASLAGSLYAHFLNFIAPPTFFVTTSIQLLAMIAIGGAQPIWGAILGAFIMTMLGEVIKTILPMFFNVGGEVEITIYGLLLVLVMMFLPKGLFPVISGFFQKKNDALYERKEVVQK